MQMSDDLHIISNSDISVELMNDDLCIIQQLDDEPNDVGGLTSAELKAKFDEAGLKIQNFLNHKLIPQIIADVVSEETRQNNENTRQSNETYRATQEDIRKQNETARIQNEVSRTNQEQERLAAESVRVLAENARERAETNRSTEESQRVRQELTRSSEENTRVFNEISRVNQELHRVSAENARVSAETARENAEAARSIFEAYDANKFYPIGAKVAYQGSSYRKQSNAPAGTLPADSNAWLLIAGAAVNTASANIISAYSANTANTVNTIPASALSLITQQVTLSGGTADLSDPDAPVSGWGNHSATASVSVLSDSPANSDTGTKLSDLQREQSVFVSGVNADSMVFISPAPDSVQTSADFMIQCVAQGENTLTFRILHPLTSVPSTDLTYNILILNSSDNSASLSL